MATKFGDWRVYPSKKRHTRSIDVLMIIKSTKKICENGQYIMGKRHYHETPVACREAALAREHHRAHMPKLVTPWRGSRIVCLRMFGSFGLCPVSPFVVSKLHPHHNCNIISRDITWLPHSPCPVSLAIRNFSNSPKKSNTLNDENVQSTIWNTKPHLLSTGSFKYQHTYNSNP